tara:strand:- start:14 stop:466 length:453 start_codon:yes stop_codon:yes gene_type:complete
MDNKGDAAELDMWACNSNGVFVSDSHEQLHKVFSIFDSARRHLISLLISSGGENLQQFIVSKATLRSWLDEAGNSTNNGDPSNDLGPEFDASMRINVPPTLKSNHHGGGYKEKEKDDVSDSNSKELDKSNFELLQIWDAASQSIAAIAVR